MQVSDGGLWGILCGFWRRYIQAATSPKDVVILVDVSGSMKGLRLTIARQTVSSILDTLGDDDFFNIIAVSVTSCMSLSVLCMGTSALTTPIVFFRSGQNQLPICVWRPKDIDIGWTNILFSAPFHVTQLILRKSQFVLYFRITLCQWVFWL